MIVRDTVYYDLGAEGVNYQKIMRQQFLLHLLETNCDLKYN
jgi:hypothetical protein